MHATTPSSQQPVDSGTTISQNQTSASTHKTSEAHILKQFDVSQSSPKRGATQPGTTSMKQTRTLTAVLLVVALAAGIGTGYGGYKLQASSGGGRKSTVTTSSDIQQVAGSSVQVGDVFGVQDEATFKDSAQGYLEIGGLDGEGSHKLLREGGESQTVYLTSSVTDLDKFDGIIVKVWGETFKGQKAGWLMDVGRVEIVDTQAEPPSVE